MSELKFQVYRGNPAEVHAGTFMGLALRRRMEKVSSEDPTLVLRAVADEIDRLRDKYPEGRIGIGYGESADVNSVDFVVSTVVGAIPSNVEQTSGAENV